MWNFERSSGRGSGDDEALDSRRKRDGQLLESLHAIFRGAKLRTVDDPL
jgi:hypothetical protein